MLQYFLKKRKQGILIFAFEMGNIILCDQFKDLFETFFSFSLPKIKSACSLAIELPKQSSKQAIKSRYIFYYKLS